MIRIQSRSRGGLYSWGSLTLPNTLSFPAVSFQNFDFTRMQGYEHKVLTYIEYRAVSGVFKTSDLPPPSLLHPASVLPPPCGEGVGGQYFGRCQTLDWPLTV